MISLRSIILEKRKPGPGSMWLSKTQLWGAMNTYGQRRYFKNRDQAKDFISGKIDGPHPYPKLKPKKDSRRVEKKVDDRADIK